MTTLTQTYGYISDKNAEKQIVKNINAFLATLERTMTKTKNKSLLASRKPYVLDYFYWNLNKDTGTWFELFSNMDKEGKYYCERHKECYWIIKFRLDATHPNFDTTKTLSYVSDVLKAPGMLYKLLEEKKEF